MNEASEPARRTGRPEGPAAPDEEGGGLRRLADGELQAVLDAHRQWLRSGGAAGACADLGGVDLQRADLAGDDLRQAMLRGADLRQADLSGANLRKADLHGANLRRADMRGADLSRVRGLPQANLQHAKLADATGLLGTEFAGVDVTGATLPAAIAAFQGLDHAAAASHSARTVFLSIVGACVYCWLTIATTSDAALISNTAASPLPIIQTKIPIAAFYWAAPVILLALYVYLHLYLQELWRSLARLPAVFPDGTPLDQRVHPWLLIGLLRAHMPALTRDRPPLWWLRLAIAVATAWALVPATLVMFWLRYLPGRDWLGTGLLLAGLLVAAWAGVAFYRLAADALRTAGAPTHRRRRPLPEAAAACALLLPTLAVSYAAIDGGTMFTAALREAEIALKPAGWQGRDDQLDLVAVVDLQGRDLRHADAVSAFLVKADLQGARMDHADLSDADLRRADLTGADLGGAVLRRAKLLEAKLTSANLQAARLRSANLAAVSAVGVDLREATLSGADLTGAKLNSAKLQNANLRRAALDGAVLVTAELGHADLRKASLRQAAMVGANLPGVRLAGADLTGADLGKALLPGADLTATNLAGARLRGADLATAVNLTQAQLLAACGDAATKLPAGLHVPPCPAK